MLMTALLLSTSGFVPSPRAPLRTGLERIFIRSDTVQDQEQAFSALPRPLRRNEGLRSNEAIARVLSDLFRRAIGADDSMATAVTAPPPPHTSGQYPRIGLSDMLTLLGRPKPDPSVVVPDPPANGVAAFFENLIPTFARPAPPPAPPSRANRGPRVGLEDIVRLTPQQVLRATALPALVTLTALSPVQDGFITNREVAGTLHTLTSLGTGSSRRR